MATVERKIPAPGTNPEIQAVWGLFMAAVITRMSLISGMLKNDASTNATRKSPKGPRVGMRMAWIQAMNFCIGSVGARPPTLTMAGGGRIGTGGRMKPDF